MACTFVGVKGDFRTKRAPFVCPNHMQSSTDNSKGEILLATYHFTPYTTRASTHLGPPQAPGSESTNPREFSCRPYSLLHHLQTVNPRYTLRPT